MNLPRTFNVMIEPTSACNLNCVYCYKGAKQQKSMSEDMAISIIDQAVKYTAEREMMCEIVWHGGEPTLAGVSFFKKVFDFIASLKSKYPITQSLQTNGTLLSEKLLNLLADHKVEISVSLDSPTPWYHEKLRPHLDAKNTHIQIVESILKAKLRGIDIRILMSITNDNLPEVKPMFDFCRKWAIDLGFNPVAADLHSRHTDIAVTPENYLKACIESFDLWFAQSNNPIIVNPAFGLVESLLKTKAKSKSKRSCQESYISIGPEGNAYPCSRFYDVEEYCFGNVLKGFENIMSSTKRQTLLNRSVFSIDKCSQCSISSYCNGGCIHHAVVHYGSIYSPDHLCKVYKGLFNYAARKLRSVNGLFLD